ncbi:hypothetical protein CI766_04025, partial [Shigella sonnei]
LGLLLKICWGFKFFFFFGGSKKPAAWVFFSRRAGPKKRRPRAGRVWFYCNNAPDGSAIRIGVYA